MNDGQERKTSLISGEKAGFLMGPMTAATVTWVYRV